MVRAVDPNYTETWNVGPARDPLQLKVKGDWTVYVRPGARLKRLQTELEAVLLSLEAQGLVEAEADDPYGSQQQGLTLMLDDLGVVRVRSHLVDGNGTVYLTMEGLAAIVDPDSVPAWIGGFLGEPYKADVRGKLATSNGNRREVFVPAELMGPPAQVFAYLTGDLASLPTKAPNLPAPVTGVWVCAPGADYGLYWDDSQWRRVSLTE